MKQLLWVSVCSGLVLSVCAEEGKSAEAVQPVEKSGLNLDWNGGADVRVRHEVIEHLPLANGTLMPNQNYFRIRPRAWGQVKNEDFKLYLRVADEFREYNQPESSHNYETPDEVLVDNLYLDLYNLFNDRVDLRIGRQDFLGPDGYGEGRVLLDGTPFDGSRTAFFDAIKATVKFDEKNTLDVLAIYNSPDTELSWGHPTKTDGSEYKERPLTSIDKRSYDMAEYGGGLYFRSKEIKTFPYELYYFFKRETKARLPGGARLQGRDTHTLGARLMPQISETLSAELEGAVQAGEKDSGASTSGYMGYAGLTYKPAVEMKAKPYLTGSCYYMSGDKSRGQDDSDGAWDPLWARWPQFSELYAYGTLYGVGYWSNLLYPSVASGLTFGPGHKVGVTVGPMYAAVEDDLGGGGGDLYGWLSTIRYDFPLVKNLFGKRGDLYGHVMAEVLDPGDYYTSDRAAYFLRWEVNARF